MKRDAASEAQVRAADPAGSTWLSANAGSGKTRVLTDRVARLLLQGVSPQKVLCLTYTKAAASEMQNRLFARLGSWAMCDDTTLRDALFKLGIDHTVEPEFLAQARTLFARAIETPGGLKIQTIHSFCASLLRRFPLEAGVNPQFQEIDERAAELLRAEIVDRMASGAQSGLVASAAQHVTSADMGKLTAEILRNQGGFPENGAEFPDLLAVFGLPQGFDPNDIPNMVFRGGEAAMITRLIPLLEASGKADVEMAAHLRAIAVIDAQTLPALEGIFLTQAGTASKRNPNKGVRLAEPDVVDFMQRLEDGRLARNTYEAARKTHVLHQFARGFIRAYTAEKRVRGWLDFDDLILKTRALLSNSTVAAWVLYRLDGGISHILVDEAQDTSRAQWDVVDQLTEEFTSGLGAQHNAGRTLFVVGDKKQSIYSFQGADPDEFDRMQDLFGQKLQDVGAPFQTSTLNYSFRSSDAILRVVDQTFAHHSAAGFVPGQTHQAFHHDQPGRVDLWPLIPATPKAESPDWTDPVDRLPDTHHTVILARQVADHIAQMLNPDTPSYIPERQSDGSYALRRVEAGDIMLLVQRRSPLFHEIIRACKQRDLPIAGADRLRVGAELAVRDLLALLSFLATPEDDLSLATVLRSPLGGMSEKQVFDLAHPRGKAYLWEALRSARALFPDLVDMLQDLRGQIDFLRPYDLLERILTRHRGREKLLARLGSEAEDGIDAILSQALGYERVSIPSLTGFLSWARADDLEIKRQIDSSGNLIRVMTVHGAKGLEAPIVILPDCGNRNLTVKDDLLTVKDHAIWKTSAQPFPAVTEAALQSRKEREARERLRLLYVAMTRAETWLIVAAAGDLNKDGADWYQTVQAGLNAAGAANVDGLLRYEFGQWDVPVASAQPLKAPAAPLLEPVFDAPFTSTVRRDDPLSPSDLGGAKALASDIGLPEDVAKARGTYVHALLEVLADASRDVTKARIASVAIPEQLTAELVEAAIAEAQDVLTTDALSWIFDPLALAEITLHGTVRGRDMRGVIDRLIVTPDCVTAVDFKTNLAVPDVAEHCPLGLLRQMGAYSDMLQQIYPDRRVETGILWTGPRRYMSLPQNLVIRALDDAPLLDVTGAGT